MPNFKQKSVVKKYKSLLLDKLQAVVDENQQITSLLNDAVNELKDQVNQFLEVKGEKYLSLYRKLNADIERHREKLIRVQVTLEDCSDEDDSQSGDSDLDAQTKDQDSRSSSGGTPSLNCSSVQNIPLPEDYGNEDQLTRTEKHNISGDVQSLQSTSPACCLDADSSFVSDKASKINSNAEGLASTAVQNENLNTFSALSNNIVSESKRSYVSEKNESHRSVSKSSLYQSVSSNASDSSDNKTQSSKGPAISQKADTDESQAIPSGSLSKSSLYQSFSSNISDLSEKTKASKRQSFPQKVSAGESQDHYQSISSLYQSVSSNVSDSSNDKTQPPKRGSVPQKGYSGDFQTKAKLPLSEIEIPSKLSGTLSHIVSPGDFWIQLETSEASQIYYSKDEYSHLSRPSSMKPYEYCLAPFKSSGLYYRAVSLEDSQQSNKDHVKVHYIDHGSTQVVPLEDLRYMPFSAYSYPEQAFHCHLHGVIPNGDDWSVECIERFKDFSNLTIEVTFKSKRDSYGVQLITKSEDLDDEFMDFSTDIALTLILEGLASQEEEQSTYSRSCGSSSNLVCCIKDPKLSSCNLAMLSNDSGVSMASNYKAEKQSGSHNSLAGAVNKNRNALKTAVTVDPAIEPSKNNLSGASNSLNLISFESSNSLNVQTSSEMPSKDCDIYNKPCLTCSGCHCLHLKVPPPNLVFVEKDMLIVMPSHVESPSEFYVNFAMDSIGNLDELREQMTLAYESHKHTIPEVSMEDLSENMFFAGFYDLDKHWYRVKIILISPQNQKDENVLVQYIDYGNSALVRCSDLRPLSAEFAKNPAFALKCSLAGVSPVDGSGTDASASQWSENAVAILKELISDDKCLTAQICWDLIDSRDAYPVLLWDTNESKDLLINQHFAELGLCSFDKSLLTEASPKESSKSPNESDVLTKWDPMKDEYDDVLNTYGVDHDDLEVLTTGYRGEDDKYVCNYFANREFCPRTNCPYLHVPHLEGGVTRDQEETYCVEKPTIVPKETTNFLVQVSAIISPSFFYVILPFGCKRVDEIEQMVRAGNTYEEIVNSEAKALFQSLHRHYSNAPFQENTAVDLAFGTIVVALRHWDKKFHRGRVVDAVNLEGLYKIFFVDFGDTEYIHRKNIRTILPQFLYTPFQSLLCCLAGVKPVGSDKWSSDAVICFKNLVEGETLLAKIVHRGDLTLHVSLRRMNHGNHCKVSELLARQGLAEFCQEKPSVGRSSRFVPG